jgi:hypothetical protein
LGLPPLFLSATLATSIKSESIYSTIAPWPALQGNELNKNVRFMSLPDGIAFLYLSGFLVVVFVIMTLLVVAMQYAEMFVHMANRNPVLSAVAGWSMSIIVAHFGGSLKSQLPALIFFS